MQTYWNGEPVKARKVKVLVGDSPKPTWWCAELAGTTRQAVEVDTGYGKPFYIDNIDGSGWAKVTIGRGAPDIGHRSLPVHKVLE